jgi:hypothetical protein
MPFDPCPKHGCNTIVGGWWRGGDAKVCMREFVREKGWLCMKFEFSFFAGHSILIRVLPPCFLALSVNELCLLFWPNPYATSRFVRHIFRMRFPDGAFMLFVGRYRSPYEISGFLSVYIAMRYPYESSCFLLHNLLMRFHSFWPLRDFMRFPNEISL